MIGRSGERWSRISVLTARHDDDDDSSFRRMALALNDVRRLICHETTKPIYSYYSSNVDISFFKIIKLIQSKIQSCCYFQFIV